MLQCVCLLQRSRRRNSLASSRMYRVMFIRVEFREPFRGLRGYVAFRCQSGLRGYSCLRVRRPQGMTVCRCSVRVFFIGADAATRWLTGSCLCAIHPGELVARCFVASVGTPRIASAADCMRACMCIATVHRRDRLLLLSVSDFLS